MTTVLESQRLRAERIGASHHADLCALLGDPRVGATLGGAATPGRVAALIEAHAACWDRDGFGLLAWFEKDTGAFVARGGVQRTHVAGRDEVEVAWAVRPATAPPAA